MRRKLWASGLAAALLLSCHGMAEGQSPGSTSETRGVRPRSALQNGIEFHLDGEFEAAEPFLRHADLYRDQLTPDEQARLNDYLARNQQALANRREALAQLYQANTAMRNARVAEAEALLTALKASKFLTAAERQHVNSLSLELKKSASPLNNTPKTELTATGRKPEDVLRDAREAFNRQQFDEAIALAHQAQMAGYWTLLPWNDTPSRVIRDAQVAQAAMPPMTPALAAKTPVEIIATSTVQAPNGKTATVTIVKGDVDDERTQRIMSPSEAKAAVLQARELLQQGKIAAAEELAQKARLNTDVQYGHFQDTPEKILKDVNKLREKSNAARAGILLAAARRKLVEGDYDEAERLAYQSEALRFDYPLWHRGDRPDRVIVDVEEARKGHVRPAVPPPMPSVAVQDKTSHVTAAADPKRGAKPAALPPLLDPVPAPNGKSVGGATDVVKAPTPPPSPSSAAEKAYADSQIPAVHRKPAASAGDVAQGPAASPNVSDKKPSSDEPVPAVAETATPANVTQASSPLPSASNEKSSSDNPATTTGTTVAQKDVELPTAPVPPIPELEGPPAETGQTEITWMVKPAEKTSTPKVSGDQRLRARTLLGMARIHLHDGEYLKVLHLVGQVKAMAWEPMDDDDVPEALIEELATVRQRVVVVDQNGGPDAARQLAAQYLIEARVREKQGRLLDALKATRLAQQCNAVYQEGEETPDAILKDLQDDCRKHLDTYAAAAKALAEYGRKCQEADQPMPSYQRYYADAERYVRYVMQLANAYEMPREGLQAKVDAVRQIASQRADGDVGNGVEQAGADERADRARQLAIQARAQLRMGQYGMARQHAESMYSGPLDARDEARELLRQIDEAEHAAATRSAQEKYHEGVQAFARKDFATAAAKLRAIDVQLLDGAKRARVVELLARPEMPAPRGQ